MTNRRVYHVTHSRNVDIIQKIGLDPYFAKGNYNSIWLAGRPSLPWAILHVAHHQAWNVEEMSIIRLMIPPTLLVRTGRAHIWRSYPSVKIEPKYITSVTRAVEWINLENNSIG